jgi:hypothetical protein
MVIRKADAETEAGVKPTKELLDAMLTYHEEMANAGILRGGDGLKPSVSGARVKFSNGKPLVYDGPFAETKELIAGYSVIEVPSIEDAIEWCKKWPPLDGHGSVELEIRPFFEVEEFGEIVTPEIKEQYDAVFAKSELDR